MRKNTFLLIATFFISVVLTSCSFSTNGQAGSTTPGAFGSDSTSLPSAGKNPTESNNFDLIATQSPGASKSATPTQTSGIGIGATPAQSTGSGNYGTQTPTAANNAGSSPIRITETPPSSTGILTISTPATGNNLSDAGRLSHLLHYEVRTQDGQMIGEVVDAVLNLSTRDMKYIIVGLGTRAGSTSIQKEVAVPCSLFAINAQATTRSGMSTNSTPSGSVISGTGNNYLILKIDQGVLNKAPTWSNSNIPQPGQPAQDWDKDLVVYWSQHQAPSENSGSAGAGTGQGITNLSQIQGVVRASDVIGYSVKTGAGGLAGEINDVVIDPNNCQVLYVVISYNSGGSNGSILIPVPAGYLSPGMDGKSLIIPNADILSAAPNFSLNEFPLTLQNGWDTAIQSYWQSFINSGTGSGSSSYP